MKVSLKQYAQTLLELTDGKSEQEILELAKKFAERLKADGQLKNAGKIMAKFSELYNEKNCRVEAQVTSRENLKLEQMDGIVEFLRKRYCAREAVVENIVDEKIGGGIIIRVGDEVLDATVDTKLKKLQTILSK